MTRLGLSTLMIGYDRAHARYLEAHNAVRTGGDPSDLDIALFETLHWAVSIDEFLAERLGVRWYDRVERRPGQGQAVPGLRFVRNQIHHQWVQAICLDDAPTLLQDWRWRACDDLPPSTRRQPIQQAAYEAHLASRALRHTFRELHQLFDGALAAIDARQ